jgi:hypothetical protein
MSRCACCGVLKASAMLDAVDTVIRIFSECRLFDEGVQIIGSWCFHLYCKHLGAPTYPLRTVDIDFLIPYPYKGQARSELSTRLEEAGFHYEFRSDGSIFFWNAELKIEFLVADKGRGLKNPVPLPKLGINAVPLRYLTMLTLRSITVMDGDLMIRLPHPTDFCLHKILIASRRTKNDKMEKDLRQALAVFQILDVSDLQQAFNGLPQPWKKKILRTLDTWSPMVPLLQEEIKRLRLTLQSSNTNTM